jgi:hypothetical protein
MGVDRGLSLDGVYYLADVINNPTQKPDWMQVKLNWTKLNPN